MKNSLFKGLMLFLTVLCTSWAYSQDVSGTVSDAGGPLPGASILVKGTTNGAQTDFDGKFIIKNIGPNAVLVFSYIGLKSQEVSVEGKSKINVTLIEDSAELKEVVVIGYGTVKKKDATGSVESIKSEDFNKGVVTSPEQLLQGKSAGVQVTSGSGEPGGANTVRIRGVNSFRSGSDPLYVIDGVAISSGNSSSGTNDIGLGTQSARNPLNFINPSDIESIDVLKDASASAIYGSRGANGVVIVTTKKGKKGAGQMTLNVSTTVSRIAHDYNLLTTNEFTKNTAATNNYGGNVNAFDDILRVAATKQYDLGFSGGSETGNYRVSLGILDQEGIVKNSGLTKYNVGYNLGQKFLDNKLKLESSMNISYIQDQAAPMSESIGAEGDLMISALKWNPTRNYTNADGSYLFLSDNQRNPQDLLAHYTDQTKTARIIGNISASYKILKNLEYKMNFGVDYSTSKRGVAMSGDIGIQSIRGTFDPISETYTGTNGVASLSSIIKTNYLIEHTLNYDAEIAKSIKLNAIVGYSFQNFTNEGETAVVTNFGSNKEQASYLDNIYSGTVQNTTGIGAYKQSSYTDPTNKLQSYFGRTIFTIADKYILNATVRRDGSSKFGVNNKYATFPAVSVAWKINKEAFSPKIFDDLKLRAGWGITGNQDFPPGSSVTRYGSVNGQYIPVNYGNNDLKWEQTAQLNAGIDFSILNNKLSGSIDLYSKETKDLLMLNYQADRPTDNPYGWYNLKNSRIKSKGFELSLNYKLIDTDDFSWQVSGNGSVIKSNVSGTVSDGYSPSTGIITGTISGQGLSGNYAQGHFDGDALYQFNLLQFEGFDANGIAKYTDVNGDNVIDDKDKVHSGSALPKYNVGLSTTLRYKNWDFVANGYGQYGKKIYDNTENALFFQSALTNGNNVPSYVVDNGEAKTGNSNAPSTRFLHSGDFFRLSNISLGYTITGKENFVPWMKSLRLYATASNIFVITPYKGFDPEVNSNKSYNGISSYGMDYVSYPKSRAFSIGLNLNL